MAIRRTGPHVRRLQSLRGRNDDRSFVSKDDIKAFGAAIDALEIVSRAEFMTEHFKFCNHCGAKMNVTPESEE